MRMSANGDNMEMENKGTAVGLRTELLYICSRQTCGGGLSLCCISDLLTEDLGSENLQLNEPGKEKKKKRFHLKIINHV